MSDITIANLYASANSGKNSGDYVPIGPLYIAAALENNGFDVDFRDYQVESANYGSPLTPESVFTFLDNCADIIGISCASELLPLAVPAIGKLKQHYPEKTVILGGISSAGIARGLLTHFPFIDIIVNGEGEETTAALMKRLTSGQVLGNLRGLCYRSAGNLYLNPGRKLLEHLDELPFPAYHKIDFSGYTGTAIYPSRGCPYRCTFCDAAPFWKHQNRTRGIDNLMAEILLLIDTYGQQTFEIMDDTFLIDKKRVDEFCQRLKKEAPGICWACHGRIDLMDRQLMETLADAGCTRVFYGAGSGADNVLKQIRKGFDRNSIDTVMTASVQYFEVEASFMWGFPNETMMDFYATLDLIDHLKQLNVKCRMFLLSPTPASSLYDQWSVRARMEFSEQTYQRVFADETPGIKDLIYNYPDIFLWFYRYPTESFNEKLEILEAGR